MRMDDRAGLRYQASASKLLLKARDELRLMPMFEEVDLVVEKNEIF
jgi:hypothetical protein